MLFSASRHVRLLVILWCAACCAAPPIITSSSSSVAAGQSITLTSSGPVTWVLKGAGSLSNATATSVTYTAPASVIPQSAILGCPVTPNDSIFNTRADNLPRNPSSALWLASMSTVPITIAPAWGITYADAATPTMKWKPYYGNNNGDYSTVYPFPWPGRGPRLKRENGNYVGVTGYVSINDHHTVTVRRSDCEYFETYNDRINGETFGCRDGANAGCNVSSVNVPYGFGSSPVNNGPYAMPYGSTDAAGLPLAPLSWHLDEIKAGAIRHATRFTSSIGYINGAIWPATTANAAVPGAPPYGARFLLKTRANGGPDLNAVCLQPGGSVNADCVTMLTGLQQYGMMLADIGTNNEIQSFTDLTEDAVTRNALTLIANARIPIWDFYAVDQSSLRQTSANNFNTFANGSYSVNPDNSFVTPVSSAVVQAIPVNGPPLRMPIALQGTAVGLASNELTIAVGVNGFQLNSWVNPPTLNQAVTWSLVSGPGSITSAGMYTPPNSTSGGSSAVLKVTAAADPNAINYVYVKLLSTNTLPAAGTIRIDSGSEVNTTDGHGNLWNSESGLEASLPTASSPDYPVWQGAEGSQYGTQLYTRGGDIAYNLVVANGNYQVRVMYGQILNGNAAAHGFTQSFVASPVTVETQGVVVAHNYDWNLAAGFHYQTAADVVVPARVVDNQLTIRAMVSTPDTPVAAASGIAPLYPGQFPYFLTAANIKSSAINGIVIVPDTSTPHWSIDAQGATAIAAGQNIQLYNIDWYTGLNDPIWTIVSGPSGASVSGTGLLSVPAGTLTNSQPLIVMASDGQFSATATFQTPASAAPPGASPPPAAPTPRSSPPETNPASAFDYVRRLTISHAQVNGSHSNFPISLSLTDRALRTESQGGHVKNSNGYDIVLATDANGTNLLVWEVEQYDGVQGQWTGHVRVPSLSDTQDTILYLLYGNAAITSSLANASGVWDASYRGVFHFASPTVIMKDSSKAAHDGIATGWGYLAEGAVGGAANVTNGSATLPLSSLLNYNSGTIELWVNSATPEDAAHNGGLIQQEWFNSSPNGFFLGWSGYSNDFEVDWKAGGRSTKISATAAQAPLGVNKWNYIAYTWDRSLPSQTLRLNGTSIATSRQAFGNPLFTAPLSFSVPFNPSYYGLTGLLDEVRFSSKARSGGWIATSYNNQKPHSNFITMAAEQRPSQATPNTPAGSSGAKPKLTGSAALRVVRKLAVLAWRIIRVGLSHLA